MTNLTPRLLALLTLIDAKPMTAAAASAAWGASADHTLTRLRILRKRGLVGCTKPAGGRDAVWASAERAPALRVELARQEKAARQAARNARGRRYKREKREAMLAQFERGPVQRIVPASKCRPIRPQAPASVFSLGL